MSLASERSFEEKGVLIFIADDSEDDVVLFHEAFETIDSRIQCVVARNGREAVHRLSGLKSQERLPQLVLMDMNMPILDGCSAVRMVREELQLAEMLIVVFTSSDLLEDFQIAYDSGANACVRKPDTYSEWVKALASMYRFFVR